MGKPFAEKLPFFKWIGSRVTEDFLSEKIVAGEAIGMEFFDERFGFAAVGGGFELQIEHGISMDHYNEYVHSVSYGDLLKSDIQLRDALLRLPQEKWIFTNANLTHAENVLSQMALRDIFTGIIDINATAPWCKPYPEAFQIALRLCGNPDPARTVFIDDRVPNLDAAASLGLRTILVGAEPSPLHPTVPRLADIQHLFV